MERVIINDINELYSKVDTLRQVGNLMLADINGFEFDCPVCFPIDLSKIGINLKGLNTSGVVISNCIFKQSIWFSSSQVNFYFNNCHFNLINANDVVFEGKIRFHDCDFNRGLLLNNTSFKNLADFWFSRFHDKVIFYKTDFFDTAVFSGAVFEKNVLFTYTLIDKLLILRGAKPKQGFDLSLAIISGELNIFDFKLKNFSDFNIHKLAFKNFKDNNQKSYIDYFESTYELVVSELGGIPINNKRETYRILKKHHESQSNIVESIPFRVLENRALFKESLQNFTSLNNKKSKAIAFSNLWVLSWNAISNWFNSSYFLGAFFTMVITALFFNLSLLSTHKAEFVFNLCNVQYGIKDYLNFLNPIHEFDYLGDDLINSKLTGSWFYIFDFIGRLFLSYGIYQTVQAFRKFR